VRLPAFPLVPLAVPKEEWPLSPGRRPIISVEVCSPDGGTRLPHMAALLDTGATVTMMAPAFRDALRLPAVAAVGRRGTIEKPCVGCKVDIILPRTLGVLRALPVVCWPDLPDPDGFQVVIGMDVLQHCVFVVDGPGHRFSFERP